MRCLVCITLGSGDSDTKSFVPKEHGDFSEIIDTLVSMVGRRNALYEITLRNDSRAFTKTFSSKPRRTPVAEQIKRWAKRIMTRK